MRARGGRRRRGRHAKARSRAATATWLVLALSALVLMGAVVARLAASPGRRTTAQREGPRLLVRGTGDPTTTVAPTTTTTTPTRQPVFARVLVVGDSLGLDLGYQLYDELEGSDGVTTVGAQGDTGLDDAAFYDWPMHLATMLETDHPTLVVVFLGANDDQGLYAGGTAVAPGSAAWDAAYAQRVHSMLAEATASGAEVAWVGMPPMSDPSLGRWMHHIDGIFEHQTARFRDALYVSSTAVLGTASGGYEASAPGPDGALLRTPDGVHLTSQGASLLATTVISAVARHDATHGR